MTAGHVDSNPAASHPGSWQEMRRLHCVIFTTKATLPSAPFAASALNLKHALATIENSVGYGSAGQGRRWHDSLIKATWRTPKEDSIRQFNAEAAENAEHLIKDMENV